MSNKVLPKVGAALVLLALVLIVLGVNYVPRIFAFSSPQRISEDAVKLVRPNYIDELYPRAISQQLSLAGSDWIERHPVLATETPVIVGSDWIERHPSIYYNNSDWVERHPQEPKE